MKNKILVVDDDMAICELLTDVLSEHVFEVRSCQLAQSALETLQQEPDIALVLLDLMLPDMSGLLLLQQIRITSYNVCYTKLLRAPGHKPSIFFSVVNDKRESASCC